MICKCGCGKLVRSGNSFILGHNRRRHPIPIENHHLCECGCGKLIDSNCRFVKGHSTSKVFKREVVYHLCECGCGKETTRDRRYRTGHNPSWNKGTKGLQASWNKGEKCPQISKSKMNHSVSEESKIKMSRSHVGKILLEEQKRKIGVKSRATWQRKTPEEQKIWIQSIMAGSKKSPNKLELELLNTLNEMFPGEYKFVGDGQVIIDGKVPDFININGQKKIIELFGDYWHRDEDPEDRAKIFRPFGYETLVIWEHELKDIEKVKFRINGFHNGTSVGVG
jgi:hypothetical protein